MTYQRMDFTKGHATENDFVLVPDPDGQHPLDVAAVRRIADRRSGIGADGVIRVVPTRHAQDDSVRAMADQAPWFMDYRNADGSLAAVCGNGTRVFAAYLRREGLQDGDAFMIGTRAGVRAVRFEGDLICVELGAWRLSEEEVAQQQGFDAMVHLPSGPLPGLSVEMGNPNTVVALPDSFELDAVDLRSAPRVEPASLEGSNVMFVQMLGEGRISLRAYERGVGETRSCGSGACAAAAATQWWAGRVETDAIWAVDVPGGRLEVRLHDGDRAELCGPAVLVADGTAELA